MGRVTSSKGRVVSVEITGIGEVIRRLRATGKDIENGVDLEVVKAGAFAEDEVKESVIGRRSEPKSVDSGLFGNSIEANKKGTAYMVVEPKSRKYPGGKVTTVDVAKFMEFGTTKISPRRHFQNTEKRIRPKIRENIMKAVKKATAKANR